MTTQIVKRSLSIAGHSTSISLEEAFWIDLKAAAQLRGISLAALVGQIDQNQRQANLSSAIRVFLLAEAKTRPQTQDADR